MKIKVNKKLLIIVLVIVVVTISGAIVYGNYFVKKEVAKTKQEEKPAENNEPKVEVYYFHRTSRCWSCTTADAYAQEAVNTYFPEEIKNGKVVYKSINYQAPADFQEEGLAEKFGVGYNALIINTVKKNSSDKQEIDEIWNNLNNKDAYLALIKGKIDKALKEIQ